MSHQCNHPDCKTIIEEPGIEKVFKIRRKGINVYIHELCAHLALKEIGILVRPTSPFHMHRLIQGEINKLKILRTSKTNLAILLMRIGVVTQKIYGNNNPFFSNPRD